MQQMSHRYAIHDSYIIKEMCGKYISGTSAERLILLKQIVEDGFFNYGRIPFEIASLAINDSDSKIRNWLAKNARDLDYREPVSDEKIHQPESIKYKYPERNLWDILKQDKDPFVRLALFENPNNPSYGIFSREENFRSLSHTERLAFMRNPRITVGVDYISPFVFHIFDITDNAFMLLEEEREELALAFLSYYIDVQNDLERSAKLSTEHEKLWNLITNFPVDRAKSFAYRHLFARDEWKARAYKLEQSSWLRRDILLNTTSADYNTLKLGLEDEDEECCRIANDKYLEPDKKSNRYWRIAKHVWTGLTNLLTLCITVAIFSVTHTSFEKLIVAMLAYIFLTIIGSNSLFARFNMMLTSGLDYEFRRVRELLKEKLTDAQKQKEKQEQEAMNEQFSKINVDYYINSCFQLLMFLVVLYYLLSTII
jgi:hypothetical protein